VTNMKNILFAKNIFYSFIFCLLSGVFFLPAGESFAQEGSAQRLEIISYTMSGTAEAIAYGVLVTKRILDADNSGFYCDPSGETILTHLKMVNAVSPGTDSIKFVDLFGGTQFFVNDGSGNRYFLNFADLPTDDLSASFNDCYADRFIMAKTGPLYFDPGGEIGFPGNHMRGEGEHVWDIAESIKVVGGEPGDVVVISSKEDLTLVKCKRKYDTRVAGVISQEPKFYMGAPQEQQIKEGFKPLALAGVVKCKVTTRNGPIKKGDLLVTSSAAGHAMRADSKRIKPGMLVGCAMENLGKGQGKINILINQ